MTSTPNILDAGGGGTVNYGTQASANDIIMCAFDLDNGKIWFGKNGTWFDAPSTSDAGDPANGNYEGLSFDKVGGYFNKFYKDCIPFELTGAQKRVIKEIRVDLGSGIQMNRLLQGDVGSGKTMVGLLSMLLALDNGYQACMIAPTEILAQQHYASLQKDLVAA